MDEFFGLREAIEVLLDFGLIDRLQSYMEIGVNDGQSLRNVMEMFTELQDVVVCDNWYYTTATKEKVIESIQSVGFPLDRVTFLEGHSNEVVPEFFVQNPDRRFDVIFVDGDHGSDVCNKDLRNVIDHADIVVAHDVHECFYLVGVCDNLLKDYRDKFRLIYSWTDPRGTAIFVRIQND